MGGKIPEIKLTAQCLVHCAVYYCLFFIGTIIINHAWFQIQVFEASYSMCILIFLLPCQQGCFKGCIPKFVVNSSGPWGSDTCIHIQLPPGATLNNHNTWIFKDAAQVMYVLENKPCRKKVIYNKKSGYGMMQMQNVQLLCQLELEWA